MSNNNTTSGKTIQRTSRHPGFYAAMKLECHKWRDELTFIEELPLGNEPNIIDMVVIKKNSDVHIENIIGKNFRGTNILEFKSPDDELSIDDFYMALSYACEYKSQGKGINSRPAGDITITLVREALPVKMFKDLEGDGAVIENPQRGLYVVKGASLFYTQVIVYGRMSDEDGLIWLRTMTKDLAQNEFYRLADEYDAANDIEYKRSLKALVSLAVNRNASPCGGILRDGEDMLELEDLKRLFKSDFMADEEKGEARGRAEGEARGRAKGAEGIIHMGREFNLSDENIISRLVSKLGFSRSEAEQMLIKFA